MARLTEQVQTADWKSEKHVPVIEAPDQVKADEIFRVTVSIGKEIAHPNKTEHHIRWISLYYQENGGKYPRQAAHVEFTCHGESIEGPDKGPLFTHHEATAALKISKSGTLYALAYCNIHGLWQSEKPITVV
ncbi:MAG: class II SORL domain-containing protein [Anaerohalosphaeraceae bacterium]